MSQCEKTDHGFTLIRAIFSMIVIFASTLAVHIPAAYAQTLSELKSRAETFRDNAMSLYRQDDGDRERIWEAYCGEFGTGTNEDKERAGVVGKSLQEKELGRIQPLLSNDLPQLVQMAQTLMNNPESKDQASEILEGLRKEEKRLNDLSNGVVLKGSNHPFVQYAIEYGKRMHKEMCDKFGEDPKVCDRDFEGGRPDLVAMEGEHLVVFEFKPDNDKAKRKGEEQVTEYLPEVVAYYQEFFEDGRNKGFKGEPPPSEYGGRKMLVNLKNSTEAWSDGGSKLEAKHAVETYKMCDKKFD